MKTGTIIAGAAAAAALAFGIYMVDFDMSGDLEMPDVDVAVEGGSLPEVDAEVGDIDVGTEEVTVTVPDVTITPPEDDGVAEEDVAQNNN